jgi:hypothetical protein
MKKAAGAESGGGRKRFSVASGFDGIHPPVTDLLTGYNQAVVLRERGMSGGSGGGF